MISKFGSFEAVINEEIGNRKVISVFQRGGGGAKLGKLVRFFI